MKLLHHSQGYSQYTFIHKYMVRHGEVTVNRTGAGLENVDWGGGGGGSWVMGRWGVWRRRTVQAIAKRRGFLIQMEKRCKIINAANPYVDRSTTRGRCPASDWMVELYIFIF